VLPRALPQADPAWFGFPVTVRAGVSRLELIRFLETRRIETRLIFCGNVLRQPGFRDIAHRVVGELGNSDTVMNDTFFLGVYPGLTDVMLDYVLESLEAFFSRR
jgi:CDP-6-deoxy-D-xylo-4-hexulose-3-dehydrase